MSRILFLAYHFPPIGGAGVQRNGKFARYLPDCGYESTVVTGPGGTGDRWAPVDATLNDDVPAGTDVRRLPGPEPKRSGGWRGRSERWLGVTSPWQEWWTEHVLRIGRELAGDIDLVYASLVPYETADAAVKVARAIQKPLVIDLQDPWALDEMMIYPSALHRRLELSRMRGAIAGADAIVMNTPESAVRVLHRWPEARKKVVVSIPNGFDSVDFEAAPPERTDDRFRIVHTGYLHTELGNRHRRVALMRRLLGGATRGVDILTRSHVFLLEAIERLLTDQPELASKVEVHLAGVLTAADREIGGRSKVVRMHGYLPHPETVALMRSADLLFLPMHDLPPGERVGIVPGKTYEYLASGRPILAAVPDGDVRELLDEAGTAFICRPADVEAMKDIISAQIRRVHGGERSPEPDPDVLARFERRSLSECLARVFDGVTGDPARTEARVRTSVPEPA